MYQRVPRLKGTLGKKANSSLHGYELIAGLAHVVFGEYVACVEDHFLAAGRASRLNCFHSHPRNLTGFGDIVVSAVFLLCVVIFQAEKFT